MNKLGKFAIVGSMVTLGLGAGLNLNTQAQGSKAVWNADGSLTCKPLDEKDKTVGNLSFKPGEVGTIFGPGKKPFDGVEITITVNSGGPKGGISGPLYQFRPCWEEISGGKMNIVEVPFAEHFPKIINDVKLGTGEFDAFMIGAFWLGDLVAGDYVQYIDDYVKDPRFPKWNPNDMPPSLRQLYTWNGKQTGVLGDADGQVLYFRRDVLNDPKWQAEYKKATGKTWNVPPKTWQEILDVSKFFNGKNWDKTDTQADSGVALHLQVGQQGHYHFMSLSAAFDVLPGASSIRNAYWFNPDNMAPLINSPGKVRALEFLQSLYAQGPKAAINWGLGETWDYFLRGKAIYCFSWGDVGGLVQDTQRSKIKGKMGASILPGSTDVYDEATKKWVKLAQPNVVGNTTGGSWHGVISKYSKNPEAVYSLLALLATKSSSMWHAYRGWDGVDPGYKYQFIKPLGDADLKSYTDQGWNAGDVQQYLKAYYDNFYAKTMFPYLRIPGTFEYWTALDQNLSAAMSGKKTAKQALDDAAKTFDEVTNRLGRDTQLKLFQSAIEYKK
jgi:multiple sugar transport system substrate-binding protein